MSFYSRTAVSAFALASVLGGQAEAQSATTSQAQGAATLGDVIVTAQRRAESAQDTPLAITVITSDALAESGVSNLRNAVSGAPSVQVQSSNSGDTFFIRGIGQIGNTGSSPVSVHMDGVFQQQVEVTGASTTDLSRIEVLRGPQGTLYGRNANGGTINIITNDPDLNGFGADFRASYGNFDAKAVDAAVNLPVSETVAVRLAGALNQRDGFLSNGLSDRNDHVLRAKLLWEPSDATRVLLSAETLTVDAMGPGNVLISDTLHDPWYSAPYNAYSVVFTGEPLFCSPNCQPNYNVDNQQYRAELIQDLPFAELTILGSHQRYRREYLQAFGDGLEGDTTPVDQSSLEVRLASLPESPIIWVVGGYILDRSATNEKYIYQINVATRIGLSELTSMAAFGQITVPLSDRLRLTGGLRYTRDDIEERVDDGVVNGATGALVSYVLGTPQAEETGRVTYRAAAEYDLAPDLLTYASLSTGYRAGGLDPQGGPYGAETITALEAGFKGRFLDRRLLLNLAAYAYDYEGYQLSYAREIVGRPVLTVVTSNVPGHTKVWGAELEGAWRATENDRLDFAVAYQGSEFADVTLATSCNPAGVCTYVNLGGRSLPRSPEFMVSAGWEHTFPFANGSSLDTYVGAQYRSDYETNLDTFVGSKQDAVTVYNARLTYNLADTRYSVSLYGNNLSNEPILLQSNKAGPVNRYGVLGDPRTYGVVLQAKF